MNSDDMTTSPTIETVLDRINQLGQQLRAEIKASTEELRAEITTLVKTSTEGLRAEIITLIKTSTEELMNQLGVLTKEAKGTNRKMEIVHKEMLQIRSDQADIEERVEKLEEKLA